MSFDVQSKVITYGLIDEKVENELEKLVEEGGYGCKNQEEDAKLMEAHHPKCGVVGMERWFEPP
jgi:hypothetical protein